METDTSCLPLLGRSVDVLSNALVELGRCGGHRPSHRESKKESGEVNHDVEQEVSTALGRVERGKKFEGTSSTRKGEV